MTKITDLIGIYDNSDEAPGLFNHSNSILGVTLSFMILSWTCALFRLYTRFFILHCPGWDDFFVMLTLMSTSCGSIMICLAVKYGGMGRHFVTLDEETTAAYLRIFYVANATYPLSAGFVKLALLFQYLRIYDPKSGVHKATKMTIVVVALWSLVYAFLGWVPTLPVSAFWDPDYSIPATRYGFGTLEVAPFVAVYTGLTASNMALDMVILGLAAPLLLYKKESGTRSRWALVSLFCVGSLASIFSILRLASLIKTRAATSPTFDPTWYGSTPVVFAALEVDVATITAALPVFWPVLRELNMTQILVTREVKVTLEHRRLSTGGKDPDDDAIELQRSSSGIQVRSVPASNVYYDDPYIAQQVNPFGAAEFGVKSDVEPGPMGRSKSLKERESAQQARPSKY